MADYVSVWESYRDLPLKHAGAVTVTAEPRLGVGAAHAAVAGEQQTMCSLLVDIPTSAPTWPPAGGLQCPTCRDRTVGPPAHDRQAFDPLGGEAYENMQRVDAETPVVQRGELPEPPPAADQERGERRGPRRPWTPPSP